jgi:microcystin degradation protein MlrC
MPFSLIWGFVSGLWNNPLVKALMPYIVGLLAVVAVYFYGHHQGYNQAKKLCNEAAYKSQVAAQQIELNNLKAQLEGTQKALDVEKQAEAIVAQNANKAKQVVIEHVTDNAVCDVPVDVISSLNALRSTKK